MPLVIAPPIKMSDDQRSTLQSMAKSSSLPASIGDSGEGPSFRRRRCGRWESLDVTTTTDTVRRWRARFESDGVEGVGKIARGRGRKSWLPEGTVAEVVRVTCTRAPGRVDALDDSDAGRPGRGRQGHRGADLARPRTEAVEGRDVQGLQRPHFEEKLVDVVGLYMDPPERAVVFSFDEKTQVQALDRTQPSPADEGRPCGHDDP